MSDDRLDPELAALMRQVRLVAFDFDGVFTDNTVLVSQDGVEHVRCWRGDGLGLRMLERLGVQTIVISTEENPVVAARCAKLKIRCQQGVWKKGPALDAVLAEAGLGRDQAAFMGNDINDAACLQMVALPVVVADAHPGVLPYARLRTRTPGGLGAVRELCDMFVAAYGQEQTI
jgi:3-deoxy-D-manno-octulosonate 8-phosphate phosphatase (KDO 8-P phosphatase)